MATVHSYARFSSKKQEEGDSTRRQREGLEKFLKEGNHTLSNLKPFFDRGKSGFRGDKQTYLNEFMKILRANDGRIKSGDILYVEAVDRLSRKGIRPTQTTVNEILNHGVDIAISLPISKVYKADNINDLGDAVELAAFAFAAHIYSALLSRRVRDFHEDARRRAQRDKSPINSGPTPSWLIRLKKDGKLCFDFKPGAKEAIEYIFQRTIEGIGGKRLTREMNATFPCFGRSGKWNEVYVRNILNDRRCLGEFQPHEQLDNGKRKAIGDVIPGYFPVVVTEETWNDANAASQNRRKERGPSGQYINLFTGLTYHALDNCPMHVYTYMQRRADGRKVIFRRLKSYNATMGVKGCHTETISIHDVEHVVLHWLEEIDLSVFDDGNKKANELHTLIRFLEKKQARIAEIEHDEETPVVLLNRQLSKLKDEVKQLTQEIDIIKTQQTHSNANGVHYLQRLAALEQTPETRQQLREAIKRVVKRITLLPAKLGKLRRDPVGSLIEIELHAGTRRRFLQLGNRSTCSFSDKTGTITDVGYSKVKKALEWFSTSTPEDGLGLHHLIELLTAKERTIQNIKPK